MNKNVSKADKILKLLLRVVFNEIVWVF